MSEKQTFKEFAETNLSEKTIWEKVPEELYNSSEVRTPSEWREYCNKKFGTTFFTEPKQKVMYRKSQHGYGLELAQPESLHQAKALCYAGFDVKKLNKMTMKKYLDIREFESLKQFRKEYGWRYIDEFIQIEDLKKELKTYDTFFLSDQEGVDPYIILRKDLADAFWATFNAANKDVIENHLLTYEDHIKYNTL
jgi:hypothetical protein